MVRCKPWKLRASKFDRCTRLCWLEPWHTQAQEAKPSLLNERSFSQLPAQPSRESARASNSVACGRFPTKLTFSTRRRTLHHTLPSMIVCTAGPVPEFWSADCQYGANTRTVIEFDVTGGASLIPSWLFAAFDVSGSWAKTVYIAARLRSINLLRSIRSVSDPPAGMRRLDSEETTSG